MTNETKSKFGFWSIVLLGINAVIGSGIFLLPGKAMALIGPGSVFVYLFMTLVVLTIALCFAECAGKFSRNGAAYVYAREAFGEFVGFEVGIMRWAIGIIAWAAMAVGFVTALSAVWPPALEEPYKTTIILTILCGLGLLNYLGVQLAKVVNNLITVGKVLPLLFFVVLGAFFIDFGNFTPLYPKGFDLDAFGAAALLIFYAFTGFEALAVAAEDMENPRRNLPLALMLVMGFCSVVYFMVQAVAVGTLGADLAKSVAPVADSANAIFGPAGKWLVTIGTLISIGGINVAASFLTPRSGVALAQDGLVPRKIAETGRFNTPTWAIFITVLLAIPVALSGSFVKLAAISVVSRFAQYVPTCLAVIVLRKKRPDLEGFFRLPLVPFIPIAAVVVSLWLVSKASTEQILWGLGAMALGVPLYFFMKKQGNA
nr:APC family permease [uncultured Anaeromusa sp.]